MSSLRLDFSNELDISILDYSMKSEESQVEYPKILLKISLI